MIGKDRAGGGYNDYYCAAKAMNGGFAESACCIVFYGAGWFYLPCYIVASTGGTGTDSLRGWPITSINLTMFGCGGSI